MIPDRHLGGLTLGTAQFGGRYGITNTSGCTSDRELKAILTVAARTGVTYFDTARVYGNAEARLGQLMSDADRALWGKISKVAPLANKLELAQTSDAGKAATESVKQSLVALRTDFIDIIMLHRSEDVFRPGVMDALDGLVSEGRIGALGASVYGPDEAVRCMADPRVRHIQIPLNPVDPRWFDHAFHQALSQRQVTVHARSAFLQGLLLIEHKRWPSWIEQASKISGLLDRAAVGLKHGRLELCLRFHRSFNWVRTSVIGVESVAQFQQIAAANSLRPLEENVLALLREASEIAPPRLYDPASW